MSKRRLPKGIRQRGDSYVCQVMVDGKRRTKSFDCVEDAVLWQAKVRAGEVSEGETKPTTEQRTGRMAWTLDEGIKTTYRVAWSQQRAGDHQLMNANKVAEFIGAGTPLDVIDTETLDELVEHLRDVQGNSPATINRKLAALSKVFSVAVDRGGALHKPKFPRQRESEGRIRFLSEDEETKALTLLKQWSLDDAHDLFIFLIDTGFRLRTEALALTKRDVSPTRDRVTAWDTKNGSPRTIPTTARVQAILRRRLAGLNETDKVFDFDHYAVRTWWGKLRTRMGLDDDPQFVPHALRHTCCTRLVQRGITFNVVKQWMGHKSLQMTMRYAQLAPTDLFKAVEVLDGKPYLQAVG
jgi:integrase